MSKLGYTLWRAKRGLREVTGKQEIFLLELSSGCSIRVLHDLDGGVDIITQHGVHRESVYFSTRYPAHGGIIKQEVVGDPLQH